MNSPDPQSTPATIAIKSIGSIAARKRRQLEQFEAARQRSMEKLNQQRAQMKKDVKDVEARERQRARNEQSEVERQLKLALGGLVLGALRAQGTEAFAFTAQDLKRLKEKDQQRLVEVLGFVSGQPTGSESAIKQENAPVTKPANDPL